MKEYKVAWVNVFFTYQRSYDRQSNHSVVRFSKEVEGEFSPSKINKVIRNYFKSWKGKGEVVITSIEAGPYDKPTRVESLLKKQEGKKIKFNNQ